MGNLSRQQKPYQAEADYLPAGSGKGCAGCYRSKLLVRIPLFPVRETDTRAMPPWVRP